MIKTEDNNKQTITITLEEYKELLVIKGKYEELKEQNKNVSPITFREPNKSKDWMPDLTKSPTVTFSKEVEN